MEFLIITGMSGAGKSKAASFLEDLGFYCVDNMPPELIPKFAEICVNAEYKKVALVMDIRSTKDFEKLLDCAELASEFYVTFKVLFLDAKNTTLINRYKETRRKHPMDNGTRSLQDSIKFERDLLDRIRERADYKIDTSMMKTSDFRDNLLKVFLEEKERTLIVNVQSFGFKHGTPSESDLMFDVRFLPNPYYIDELREKNGTQQEIVDYVFENGVAEEFMVKLRDMIDFLIPKYIDEGKISLVVAIGCTGGKHRSVAICENIVKHIKSQGYSAVANHRDIGKV